MFKSVFLLILAFIILLVIAPIIFIAQTISTFSKGAKQNGFKQGWSNTADYFYIVAVDGLDQLGATILYKVRDLTVSSYTHILCNKNKVCWFRKLIDLLFGAEHCKISAQKELIEFEEKVIILKKEV